MKNRRTLAIVIAFALCILLITSCSTPPLTYDEQISLGNKYLSEGNYKEAILAFEAAIKIDPKKVLAYIGIADVFISSGDLDSAEAVLQKGIDMTDSEELKLKLDDLLVEETSDAPIEEFTTEVKTVGSEDTIEIISVSPATVNGGDTQVFTVRVLCNLVSSDKGVLMIGFNTDKVDSYNMLDMDKEINSGTAEYEYTVSTEIKDWGSEGKFSVYVNVSDLNHSDSWTPFAADIEIIEIR